MFLRKLSMKKCVQYFAIIFTIILLFCSFATTAFAKDLEPCYIDELAAEVVRYIFKLAMEGLGPTKIANRLREEKYITPTEYFFQINRKTRNERPVDPYNWQNTTVKHILDNPQYTGCTVNGKRCNPNGLHRIPHRIVL